LNKYQEGMIDKPAKDMLNKVQEPTINELLKNNKTRQEEEEYA
jgi:hypothetical protein